MTPRQFRWAIVGLLGLVSPVLAFPAVLGPSYGWLAALVGIASMLAAVGLAGRFGSLAWSVGLLSVTALVGWSRVSDEAGTLNHFCGLALGLAVMVAVPVWCRTRQALVWATVAVLVFGIAVLAVGFRSVSDPPTKLMTTTRSAGEQPTPLPLRQLHARQSVNPNALAATAMLILPVAVAMVWSSRRASRHWLALRVVGLVTATLATTVMVLMQSRSAWMAAMVVLWLVSRRWLGARAWWFSAVCVFLVVPATVLIFGRGYPPVETAVASLSGRVDLWMDGLRALRTAPWLGIGLDYFRHSTFAPQFVEDRYYVGAPHVHNFYVQTALDVGLLGLMAYVAVLGFVMRRAQDVAALAGGDRWVRAVGVGAALSLVAIHVYGVTDAIGLGAKVGIFQWLACGLVLAAWRIQSEAPVRTTSSG